jgi:hypothetical protein
MLRIRTMQRRTPPSGLADWVPSDADLRRIQRWLRWLTIASALAFVILLAEGAKWWAVRASWSFVVMLALNLVVGVPVQLMQIYRAWTGRRQSRQSPQVLADTYDEIIASRRRRSD